MLTPDESIAELKKVTLDDAKKFYTDFYGASNAELAVVGDFDAAKVEKLARGTIRNLEESAALQGRDADLAEAGPDQSNHRNSGQGQRVFRHDFPGGDHPGGSDYPALVVANLLTGGDEKSRLWARVREKEGLSYGVSSGFQAGIEENYGRFSAAAIYAPQNVVKVETAIKDEFAKIVRDGFTTEKWRRPRRRC